MSRKWMCMVILTLLTGLFAGCGNKDNGNEPDGNGAANKDDRQTVIIAAYFSDKDFTELVERQVEIRYEGEDDKLLRVIEGLKSPPDDKVMSLWSGVDFKSAKLSEGRLAIDMHIPEDSRLGAPGEALALQALEETCFGFDDVQSISITVDGKATDTLMGHVELPASITREN